jgi:hypothetical protein
MATGRRTTASHRRIPGVRTASVQDYFKRRARNWRARRLRVNALALRPGRSRFAARARAFATRGLRVRRSRGVGQWRGAASAWPTLAAVSPDCLSAHRETSRPNLSLVHSFRGRSARAPKQPRRSGQKSGRRRTWKSEVMSRGERCREWQSRDMVLPRHRNSARAVHRSIGKELSA